MFLLKDDLMGVIVFCVGLLVDLCVGRMCPEFFRNVCKEEKNDLKWKTNEFGIGSGTVSNGVIYKDIKVCIEKSV
jgi:hypothetical protein